MQNKYTKIFIEDLHKGINNSYYSELPTEEDYAIIDEIVERYYSSIFWKVYIQKKKTFEVQNIIHNPELAKDFNEILITLINESVRLFFWQEAPISTMQKYAFFESQIKTISKELVNYSAQNLTNEEILEKVSKAINEEFTKMKEQHKLPVGEYALTPFKRLSEYLNQKKLYLKNKTTEFIFSKINYKEQLGTIIIFLSISLLFAIVSPVKSTETILNIYKIVLIVIILLAFSFPYYINKSNKKINDLKKYINPPDYLHLGIDIVRVDVSKEEVPYVDPEEKDIMLPIASEIRLDFIHKYGLILPDIRYIDNSLVKSGYKIFIRSKEVFHIDISAVDYVITEEQKNKYNIEINDNFKKEETIFGTYYIVDENYCKNLDKKQYYTGAKYFRKIFSQILMKNVRLIVTEEFAAGYLNLFFSYSQNHNKSNIRNNVDLIELKEVLIKILEKNYSLKDINYVMEKYIKYSKHSTDTDYIAFQIIYDMEKDNFIVECPYDEND